MILSRRDRNRGNRKWEPCGWRREKTKVWSCEWEFCRTIIWRCGNPISKDGRSNCARLVWLRIANFDHALATTSGRSARGRRTYLFELTRRNLSVEVIWRSNITMNERHVCSKNHLKKGIYNISTKFARLPLTTHLQPTVSKAN